MSNAEEWRWDGSLWGFIEIVQWAVLFHRLGTEKPVGWSEIMTSPDMVRTKAEEYGLTYRAIAKEMVRQGSAALKLINVLRDEETDDLHNESNTDSIPHGIRDPEQ